MENYATALLTKQSNDLPQLRNSTEDEAFVSVRSVCVVGLGYIGLPTAAILARTCYQVHGVDVRQDAVARICAGEAHIFEPDLDELVRAAVSGGKLTASTDPKTADVYIICVPTPVTPDHRPDLRFVQQAAQSIRAYVKKGDLIILESTSPPSTTEQVVVKLAVPDDLVIGRDVFVAYCPERVLPGRILADAIENDRIVGGITETCSRKAKEFYETFVRGNVFATSAVTAELVKLAENSFRDVNIAFANELANLAERFDADPFEIVSLANRHPRVDILNPGPGVGGHCIPVDPWFLVHAAPGTAQLIRTAREVNDLRPAQIVDQIAAVAQQHTDAVIGCLGLTYKADVDDLRESPSIEIVRQLQQVLKDRMLVCDPLVRADHFDEFPLSPLGDVLDNCNVLVLLTDHSPFRAIPPEVLSQKTLIDPHGAWRVTPPLMRTAG
jgi:UDP-N-acetyl-D-mannosaminuronic acid dehydrogenase